MSATVLLTGPWRRIRVTICGFQKWTGTRGVMLVGLTALASRQRRCVLTWSRRDRLPALYQLDNLVGFPGEVTVRPERIVPTAIRAEIKRQDMKVRKTDGIAAIVFNACAFSHRAVGSSPYRENSLRLLFLILIKLSRCNTFFLLSLLDRYVELNSGLKSR